MHKIFKNLKQFTQPLLLLSATLCLATLAHAELSPMPSALKLTQPGVKLTLLEFSAPWCISCQLLKPELKKLQTEVGPSLKIIDLNIEKSENQFYIKRYEVLSTPTILLFNRSGKMLQKLDNDFTAAELHQIVLKQFAKNK